MRHTIDWDAVSERAASITDGIALVGRPAWHGLGTVLAETDLTAAAATQQAGMGWQVVQCPLYTREPRFGFGPGVRHVPGHVANVRSDSCHILGVVGVGYRPLQQYEIAETIDGAGLKIETAGTLKGGEEVWYLARLGSFGVGASRADKNVSYALFSNNHAGQRSFTLTPISIRVACANTLSIALHGVQAKASGAIKLRHTAQLDSRVRDLTDALGEAREQHALFGELAAALAAKSLTDAEQVAYWRRLYSATVGEVLDRPATAEQERRAARWAKRLSHYRELAESRTNRTAAIAGTAWAALNVATEAVDHYDPRSGERLALDSEARQLRALVSPEASKLKAAALTLAAALV